MNSIQLCLTYQAIKEKYESAPEARNIDGLIGMVQ
jgi:hypothetical protein